MVPQHPRPLTKAPAADAPRAARIRRRNRDLARLSRLGRQVVAASVLATGGLFALVATELPGRPPTAISSSTSTSSAPTSSGEPTPSVGHEPTSPGSAGSDQGGSLQPGSLAPASGPAPVATGAS